MPIFKKSSAAGPRILFFALVAVSLIVLDRRFDFFQDWHAKLSGVVAPIQILVDDAGEIRARTHHQFQSAKSIDRR